MEKVYIQWNVFNILSIWLMIIILYVVFGFGASAKRGFGDKNA